jgi:hypothetical protein
MLNPNSRALYTDMLTAPVGMVFDEAVAATFSMDPMVLLEAPVHLALQGAGGKEPPDPLAILDSVRRFSRKITVCVQNGQILVPSSAKPNPLFGLLEEMCVEMVVPKGGVFHPKLWCIRFQDVHSDAAWMRLVILSRNMTLDRSWDLSLQLDGPVGKRNQEVNRPLARFFNRVQRMTKRPLVEERAEQLRRFSREIKKVQWELPEGFDELSFALPGDTKYPWQLPRSKRLMVISPFCSDAALQQLAQTSDQPMALVSRPETLESLDDAILSRFGKCLHLHDAAETEDGEEVPPTRRPLATGLHAKAYILETRHYSDFTHIVLGSANATNAALGFSNTSNAALVRGVNVEILAELKGKKSRVGGIDQILDQDGLGELLADFHKPAPVTPDPQRQEAEKALQNARKAMANAQISLVCEPASQTTTWKLTLIGPVPVLPGIVHASAWPITLDDSHAVAIKENVTKHGDASPQGYDLGSFSAASLTGLIAFALHTDHPDVFARFVLNLPVSGLPDERDASILRTVLANKDGFLRYLLLLLGQANGDGLTSGNGTRTWGHLFRRLAHGDDVALLEELTRTYSRAPERLQDVKKLVHDLQRTKADIIPEHFLQLWSVFETALEQRREH